MRVLIVGGGGREHALGWALRRSRSVDAVASLPGNPGLAQLGATHAIDPMDTGAIVDLATRERFDLVVVGPEAPLDAGLADALAERRVTVFGPHRGAARIESSKVFAREFMRRHSIPSTRFAVFERAGDAEEYLSEASYPLVVKADGLAAGKGVVICHDEAEARRAVRSMLDEEAFGAAGRRVVVEDFLEGEEVSVLALTDGREIVTLLYAQDHKPVFDGDRGPNTGGMGAFAPWAGGDEVFANEVKARILRPTIDGLATEGTPFRGCLYAGLMATPDGPRVVEFNCRFGDPETQVVLPLLEDDLGALLMACARGELEPRELRWHGGVAVSVVLASGGYPGPYRKGLPISGIDEAISTEGVVVFHAGTRQSDGGLVTAGGRVLDVTAVGETLEDARVRAYGAASRIRFDDMHMRRDIGSRARSGARAGM